MNKETIAKQTSKQLRTIFRDKSLTPQQRGEKGEEVIYNLVDFWRKHYEGSKIYGSLIYPQGPILPSKSGVAEPVTESDIVVVTPYRILALEVKTVYGELEITEDGLMYLTRKTRELNDKNYIRQNEMHCRHLYHHLHGIIPNGTPDYIQSIIVLCGNMTFEDKRSDSDKAKHPIVNVNQLIPQLDRSNAPLDFLLDIGAISKKINRIKVNNSDRLLESQSHLGGN